MHGVSLTRLARGAVGASAAADVSEGPDGSPFGDAIVTSDGGPPFGSTAVSAGASVGGVVGATGGSVGGVVGATCGIVGGIVGASG